MNATIKTLHLEEKKQLQLFTTLKLSESSIKEIAKKNEITHFDLEIFEGYQMAKLNPVFDYFKYVLNY
jgi:hypothetical protein